jgi:hypothetical protein
MHGYIASDKNFNTLVFFRTWRNTIAGERGCGQFSGLFRIQTLDFSDRQ